MPFQQVLASLPQLIDSTQHKKTYFRNSQYERTQATRSNLLTQTARVVCFILILTVLYTAPKDVFAQSGAARISKISDVLSLWNRQQRLYVKGDLGVFNQQFDALEEWLDENAPNWAVVLMNNAEGESYTDAQGKTYIGVWAVNHALGKGLTNSTAFGAQTDPRTKERNAAFLVIFLKERKLTYYGSEAQDLRGLGEKNWQGNLDRWAVSAMRNGGRVIDAVKDTIVNINALLDRQILAETSRKEQSPGRDAKDAAALAQNFLKAAGERYAKMKSEADALERSIKEQSERNYASAGAVRLRRAEQHLAAARSLTADKKYSEESERRCAEEIRNARVQIAVAGTEIDEAQFSAALKIGFPALASISLFGFGWNWNRKRLPKKEEAEGLLNVWTNALGEKLDSILGLMERARAIIVAPGEQSKYSGATLELSRRLIADIDESFIMLFSSSRLLKDADALIRPKSVHRRLYNLFFEKFYKEGASVLRDQPIAFKPEERLEPVMRSNGNERSRLLGSIGDYKPFSISFNKLIEEFDARYERALCALDRIDVGLNRSGKEMEAAEGAIRAAESAKSRLNNGDSNNLFLATPLFSRLIPAAQDLLSETEEIAPSDPVRAMEEMIPEARRRANEASMLADLLIAIHSDRLPKIRADRKRLEEAELSVHWIEEELMRLSVAVDLSAEETISKSKTGSAEALRKDLEALVNRVERAAALDEMRRTAARKTVDDAIAEISVARLEIACALKMDAERIMRESGSDPSDYAAKAEERIAASKPMLDVGDVDAAEIALNDAANFVREASSIVAASRSSFYQFEAAEVERRAGNDGIVELMPDCEAVLLELEERYAPSALMPGAIYPDRNGTLRDDIVEVDRLLASCKENLRAAHGAFREARLLETSRLLDSIKRDQEIALSRLAEIMEFKSRLAELEQVNAERIIKLEGRRKEVEAVVGRAATMRPTISAFECANRLAAASKASFESAKADPFKTAEALDEAMSALENVAEAANNDLDLYLKAKRQLESATSRLRAAQSYAQEAASESFGESQALRRARSSTQSLSNEFEAANRESDLSHGDWNALCLKAESIEANATAQASILREGLTRARKASEAISEAMSIVASANNWIGSYGILISGSPGASDLSRAKSLILNGDYDEAAAIADAARIAARTAIWNAESEVARLRREEENRNSLLNSTSSNWDHNSSSSSSWSDSSSGSSTSSFGGSDSGNSSDSGTSTSSY